MDNDKLPDRSVENIANGSSAGLSDFGKLIQESWIHVDQVVFELHQIETFASMWGRHTDIPVGGSDPKPWQRNTEEMPSSLAVSPSLSW